MVEESKRLFHGLKERFHFLDNHDFRANAEWDGERGVDMFREMILARFTIDQFTFGSVLTACGSLLAFNHITHS